MFIFKFSLFLCFFLLFAACEDFSKCNYFQNIFRSKESCIFNPDEYLDVPQIIARHGYNSETHVVVTEDGYLLEIHRIPGPKNKRHGEQPVFLQHGLLGSSADWIINGNNSLGFLLADKGYDVWLGNARGNTYSKGHMYLPVDSSEFWNFSWHEMGTLDLPAVLNYISGITGKPGEITYIGFSMGTTMFFVLSSCRPQAAKHVKQMVAMAPIAYMTRIRSPIKYLAPFSNNIQRVTKFLGLNQFMPSNKLTRVWIFYCSFTTNKRICQNLIFLLCGFDKEGFNEKILPVVLNKVPAGTSTKTVVHYAQEVRNNGNFQQFDYGRVENKIQYGTETPPKYDISNIKTPIYLIYGMNDWLSSESDVQRLASRIPILAGKYKVNLDSFNHVDFLFGKHAEKLVYQPLIKRIANFNEQ